MKIFDRHTDLVLIIKYFMFINSLNMSTKSAVFTTLDAMYTVVCNCCHVLVFMSERYCLDLKEIYNVFLKNKISSKSNFIFSIG